MAGRRGPCMGIGSVSLARVWRKHGGYKAFVPTSLKQRNFGYVVYNSVRDLGWPCGHEQDATDHFWFCQCFRRCVYLGRRRHFRITCTAGRRSPMQRKPIEHNHSLSALDASDASSALCWYETGETTELLPVVEHSRDDHSCLARFRVRFGALFGIVSCSNASLLALALRFAGVALLQDLRFFPQPSHQLHASIFLAARHQTDRQALNKHHCLQQESAGTLRPADRDAPWRCRPNQRAPRMAPPHHIVIVGNHDDERSQQQMQFTCPERGLVRHSST